MAPDGSHPLFEVRTETADDRCTLFLLGELDLSSVAVLQEARRDASKMARDLTLDLSDLRFLDSSGLREILQADAEARSNGHTLSLRGGQPNVMRVFQISGLVDRLPFEVVQR